MKTSLPVSAVGLLAAVLLCPVSHLSAQLAAYDFEDTSGPSLNVGTLGASYDLTLRSGAVISGAASGPQTLGRALDLTASTAMGAANGAYADVAAAAGGLSGLSAMTITGWFKPSAAPISGATLLRNSSGSGSTTNGWSLVFNGGQQLRLVIGNGSSATTYLSGASAYAAGTGQWQFFAVSWSASGGAHWYTATETATPATAGSSATAQGMGTATQRLTIGRSNSGGGAFDGQLDDLRVYGSELIATEVATTYDDSHRTPRPSGSLLPYPAAWSGDTDSRRSQARQLYLSLLDRSIADNQASQLNALATAETNGTALSRYSLFLCYGQAYRASLAPASVTGAAATVRASYIENGRRALFAVTNGIEADPSAQAAQLMFCQGALVQLYRLLVDLGALTPTEQTALNPKIADGAQAVLDYVAEYGSFNRASCDAYGVAATAQLVPSDARASGWNAFATRIWNDWKHVDDTFEDARGYNGLWLFSTILQAREMGLVSAFDEPAVETLMGRFVPMVAPNGTMPDFGGCYWDHGVELWPFVYEWLGTHYGRADLLANATAVAGFVARQPAIDLGQVEGLVEVCRVVGPSAGSVPTRPAAVLTQRTTDFGDVEYDKLYLSTGSTSAAAYVCFDLHDQGYHGHADGGSLSLYTVGEHVLLHTLGREELFENQHQSVWAAPDTTRLLSSVSQHAADAWTQWIVPFRWPGTYTGSYPLDIAHVTGLFFRFEDPAAFTGTVTLDVDPVIAVRPDGTSTQIHAGWTGSKAFSAGTTGESAFMGPSGLTLDLSDYAYLLVRWKSNQPDSAAYFGFNGSALNTTPAATATLRTRASSITESAYAADDTVAPSGGFTRLMADAAGRLIRHQRDVRLRRADGALAVVDTFEFLAAGYYVVGPIWHTQNIVSQGADYLVARDDAQYITSAGTIAEPASPLRFDFAATDPFSIVTRNYAVAHPQDEHFSAACSGDRAAGDKVTIVSFLRPGTPAAPTQFDVTTRHAEITDTIGTLEIAP